MTKMLEVSLLGLILNRDLADKGTLVGSRAQGFSTHNSDWDYMFLEEYKEDILNYLRFMEISFNTNPKTGSIKFFVMFGDVSYAINFIFVANQENYTAWIKATEILKIVGNNVASKLNRIRVFCDLVDYFGGDRPDFPNYSS